MSLLLPSPRKKKPHAFFLQRDSDSQFFFFPLSREKNGSRWSRRCATLSWQSAATATAAAAAIFSREGYLYDLSGVHAFLECGAELGRVQRHRRVRSGDVLLDRLNARAVAILDVLDGSQRHLCCAMPPTSAASSTTALKPKQAAGTPQRISLNARIAEHWSRRVTNISGASRLSDRKKDVAGPNSCCKFLLNKVDTTHARNSVGYKILGKSAPTTSTALTTATTAT